MTNNLEDSVSRLAQYVNDLTARLEAKAEWFERHPDHESDQYKIDSDHWHQPGKTHREILAIRLTAKYRLHRFQSSFNPNDRVPKTNDALSAERFNDLCIVALSAFSFAKGDAK